MKKRISISAILVNLVLALITGLAFAAFVDGSTTATLLAASSVFLIGTGGQLVFGSPKGMKDSLYMALQTEVWVQDVMDTLFYENEFLNLAVDHSAYVQNKTVHVPQSGGKPNVVKNRTEDVADLDRRTDTELVYSLDNYTTDPFLVKDIEDLQISYDKRQSVMGQHIATLGDVIAVETLQKWAVDASTSHVLRTTGPAEGGLTLTSATATGTRNLLTYQDIARAAARMDIDKVPKQGRFGVIPTAMFYGLFSDKELLNQQALVGKDMLVVGVVAKLFNFNLITRGEVVRYTNASANNLRGQETAATATDCAGAVFFSRFMVSQALGEIKMYYNPGEARSYGDIMSAEVNHAAAALRAANVGRVSIAQGYVAP
jgi:hypothetical protein